jgi:hypothetical protein
MMLSFSPNNGKDNGVRLEPWHHRVKPLASAARFWGSAVRMVKIFPSLYD